MPSFISICRLTNGELTITKSHGLSVPPPSSSSSSSSAANQQQHQQQHQHQSSSSSSSNSGSTNPLSQASHHHHHSHHSHHQHPSSGHMHLAHSIPPVKLSPSSMHLSPSGTDNSTNDPLDDSPSKYQFDCLVFFCNFFITEYL